MDGGEIMCMQGNGCGRAVSGRVRDHVHARYYGCGRAVSGRVRDHVHIRYCGLSGWIGERGIVF